MRFLANAAILVVLQGGWLAGLAPVQAAAAETKPASRPPNILFIYTDQQRYDTLAVYGNEKIDMPNLNALAGQSTVFMRAYPSSPICSPSRSTMLTGTYPHQNGVITNNIPIRPTTRCLPEYLPEGKWRTAHMGKWHLGDEIYAQHGFTVWKGTEDTYHHWYSDEHDEYADRSAYHHWLKERGVKPQEHANVAGQPWLVDRFFRGQIHSLPEAHCRPKYLGETASQFIRDHAKEPFILYVNFLEPHHPYHSARDRQYDPSEVVLPPNYGVPFTDQHNRAAVAAGRRGQQEQSEEQLRETIARYWGMNSLVDTYCGQILDTLEETGADERTIVVFTTDHGDMMGEFGLGGKSVMYEASARIPLLVRLPGQTRQRKIDSPVSHIDLVPTLLDFVGSEWAEKLPGKSLMPALRGEQEETGRDVFVQWNLPPRSRQAGVRPIATGMSEISEDEGLAAARAQQIRTIVSPDRWKFNYSSSGDHELFHLKEDPHERVNLYGHAQHAAKVRELAGRILAWQEKTGDVLALPRLE